MSFQVKECYDLDEAIKRAEAYLIYIGAYKDIDDDMFIFDGDLDYCEGNFLIYSGKITVAIKEIKGRCTISNSSLNCDDNFPLKCEEFLLSNTSISSIYSLPIAKEYYITCNNSLIHVNSSIFNYNAEVIDLSCNNISSGLDNFPAFTDLHKLDLSHNQLAYLNNLPHCRNLNISNNQIYSAIVYDCTNFYSIQNNLSTLSSIDSLNYYVESNNHLSFSPVRNHDIVKLRINDNFLDLNINSVHIKDLVIEDGTINSVLLNECRIDELFMKNVYSDLFIFYNFVDNITTQPYFESHGVDFFNMNKTQQNTFDTKFEYYERFFKYLINIDNSESFIRRYYWPDENLKYVNNYFESNKGIEKFDL